LAFNHPFSPKNIFFMQYGVLKCGQFESLL
jgi:hypothetical protein